MNFKQRLDRYLTQSDEQLMMDVMPQVESLEFADSFDYDEHGLITNPGKFERECRYVPYYWGMTLHGAQDEDVYDRQETLFSLFTVTEVESELFGPDLAKGDSVAIYESENGFVAAFVNVPLEVLVS